MGALATAPAWRPQARAQNLQCQPPVWYDPDLLLVAGVVSPDSVMYLTNMGVYMHQ